MPVLAPSVVSTSTKVPRRAKSSRGPKSNLLTLGDLSILVYEDELWTSGQRQANPIHEISYRACFKPQLPAYFIERLTKEGDVVYDPFSGRGTTAVEAALHARNVIANDANPLSAILTYPRLELPCVADIDKRLRSITFPATASTDLDLSMFFHQKTLYELLGLRHYLARRWRDGTEDSIDRWIRMVATNRLTGHSPGFFSVYTLPPNQAVTAENQVKINQKLGQKPEYRDVRALILRKTMQLQGDSARRTAGVCTPRQTPPASLCAMRRPRRPSSRIACNSRSHRRRSSMSSSTRATTGCAAGSMRSTPRRSASALP